MAIKEINKSLFIEGFTQYDVSLENRIKMRVSIGGEGEPLVLLHGYPQNHVTWHKIAPMLAEKYKVILPDLRGYGDSDKPSSDPLHRTYSKREMAKDIVLLMKELGHSKFAFVGHDRGGRVGHRLALDYPESLTCAVFLDIAPTATMYDLTDKEFATSYYWWFFLIQDAPLPEKMIGLDPNFFLRSQIEGQLKTPHATSDEIFNEYLRCFKQPETIHAICEDYRAAATIDLEDDSKDSEKRIECPLLVLWGAKGAVGHLFDVLNIWKPKAKSVTGEALPCGHTPQEEVPDLLLKKISDFIP